MIQMVCGTVLCTMLHKLMATAGCMVVYYWQPLSHGATAVLATAELS